MAKQRVHNEWFRIVSLNNRKSCPACRHKLGMGECVWSWGEYVHGIWRTVKHFCNACYADQVYAVLTHHAFKCGCTILFQTRGETRPEWMHERIDDIPATRT